MNPPDRSPHGEAPRTAPDGSAVERPGSAGGEPTHAAAAAAVDDDASQVNRLVRTGVTALGAFMAFGALWTALAPISGAVIASGVLRPLVGRQAVLAADAGVVLQWQAHEGELVRAGQPLMTLHDPDTLAQRDSLVAAAAAERLRIDRLQRLSHWRAGTAAPRLPVAAGVPAPLAQQEQALLDASWQQEQSLIEQLERQSRDTLLRVRALELAVAADASALELSIEELRQNEGLLDGGFISAARLLSLRRAVQESRSRLEAQRGLMNEARERLSDLLGQLKQEPSRFSRDQARDHVDAQRRLADIDARSQASAERMQRLTLLAPLAGRIVDLRPLGPGSVVSAGQVLMEIVPADAPLRVEARVRPEDIAEVHLDATAEVRITAYPMRQVPALAARVVLVGADRSSDPRADAPRSAAAGAGATSEGNFTVWLALESSPVPLSAGMGAEVFIHTKPRTPLDYWLAPLTRLWQRAGRER